MFIYRPALGTEIAHGKSTFNDSILRPALFTRQVFDARMYTVNLRNYELRLLYQSVTVSGGVFHYLRT